MRGSGYGHSQHPEKERGNHGQCYQIGGAEHLQHEFGGLSAASPSPQASQPWPSRVSRNCLLVSLFKMTSPVAGISAAMMLFSGYLFS
jgi:hypothetical protein